MEPLIWKPEYDLGHETIDQQHRALATLINRLGEENSRNGAPAWVFAELDQYVKEHFAAEEELMRQGRYPDFTAHKKQHRDFETWLDAVRQTHALSVSSRTSVEALEAHLQNWLITHILKSDMAYKPWVAPTAAQDTAPEEEE